MSIDKDQVEDWINHPVTEYIKTYMLKELELKTVSLINMSKQHQPDFELSRVELLRIAQADYTLNSLFNEIPELLLQGESLYE